MDKPEKPEKHSGHYETAEKDRVPFIQKLAIGMGEFPGVGNKTIERLALPVFHLGLGVDPLLVGVVTAMTRLLDAFTDPLAGTISDNTRTRFGRRRPFLFGSSIICGLTLPVAYMMSPEWSQYMIMAWFFAGVCVFYTSYSFYNVPLMAISYEVTPDYHERTRVYVYKVFFLTLNALTAAWLFRIIQLDRFGGTLEGIRVVSVFIGAIIIVFGLIPAFLVKERNLEIVEKTQGLSFIDGVRETLKNKAFMVLCLVVACRDLSGKAIETFGLYILIFYVFTGANADELAGDMFGIIGTAVKVSTLLLLPTMMVILTRTGKSRVLHVSLVIALVFACMKFFVFMPQWPELIIVYVLLHTPLNISLNTMVGSMMADVCDYDEIKTGRRREGMYASIYSWIDKAIGSLAVLLSGGMLKIMEMQGFERGMHVTEQSEGSILLMRLSFAYIPAAGFLLALIALRFFPIDEEEAHGIRKELERRRGADYVES